MTTIQERFATREEAKAYYTTLNKGINEVCGACYEFAKVAERFDNKVLNKRFITTLNEALIERFGSVEREGRAYPKVQIYAFDDSTMVQAFRVSLLNRLYDKPTGDGYKHAIYFDKELYLTVRVPISEMNEGNRINAEAFVKAAQWTADQNLRVYERYREALVRWEKELQAVEELNAYIKSVNKELEERVSKINQLFIPDDMRDLSGHSVWCDAKYSGDWYKKNENK